MSFDDIGGFLEKLFGSLFDPATALSVSSASVWLVIALVIWLIGGRLRPRIADNPGGHAVQILAYAIALWALILFIGLGGL
jgi:hypothetical protein